MTEIGQCKFKLKKIVMTREEIIFCRKALVAFLFMMAAMCLSMLTSCSNEDEMFDRETTEVLPSVFSEDRTLYTDTEYLISKPVFVTNGATLTIQRGALLKALPASGQGKAAIVITKGCKIVANGTEDAPIVMTALIKEPGSWDGVIVLGKAPVSYEYETLYCGTVATDISYGGSEGNDDSGSLQFVRVEYAGAAGGAVTFDGVGRGTTIDHCQSYCSGGDGFMFNGGTVNARYLISTGASQNGLCFNEGYTGKLQYVMATAPIRKSVWSVVSCNGTGKLEVPSFYTHPVIANLSTAHDNKSHGRRYPIAVSAYSRLTLVNSSTREAVADDDIPVQLIGGQPGALPGIDYILINATREVSSLTPDRFVLDTFFERTDYEGAVAPDVMKDRDWTKAGWVRQGKKP